MRNGNMWTVIDGVFVRLEPAVSHGMTWCKCITDLDDSLKTEYYNLDVMEIYAAPSHVVEYFEYNVPTKLIWKRNEKSEAELRLEAMQKQMKELQENMDKLQQEIKDGQ